MAEMKELKNQMASMQSKQSDLENQLLEERKLRKSTERKAKSLQEKLDFANQERFGERRQRIHSKSQKSDSDRQKDARMFSSICAASSLVGARTSARTFFAARALGAASIFEMTGSAKAAVLPVPV